MAQEPGAQGQAILAGPAEEDLIIVTGSRIQRRNTDTAAPVAVVTDEEFQLSGTVNVENVINTLPQVVPGFTATSNNPGTGTATLNLRGLGEERSLVLVNGRRWMFYYTEQLVDLNTVPSFLIDTVDVVTGGASAVYGSDAIAGVVNFRLRDVVGLELGGQVASTQEGDGFRYEVHGAIGTELDDGRGHATVFAEYYKRQPVFQGDRDFSLWALGGESFGDPLGQFGSSTPPELRFNAPGNVAINEAGDVTAPLGEGLIVDDAFFASPGSARPRTGRDLYNFAPANYLQIPQERFLIGGYADYEIADGHTAYTEVSFVNNRVALEQAATPVTGTFDVDIATVAPFVDASFLAALQQLDANETAANAARVANGLSPIAGAAPGVVSASLQRRVLKTGPRNELSERNAFRVLGGTTGPIGEYVTYDGYYMYARTRNSEVQAGNISHSAFQAGLDGTGTPIDIFGPGTLTPDQVDAITILAQNGEISTLEIMSGSVNGTVGDFALGEAEPVAFALGFEHRKVPSEFLPETALASGDVIGFNAGEPTAGDYSVKEVFAELNVPIEFGGMRLELTGAGRYSDYTLDAVGSVWTCAGGAEFGPTDGVVLRGQYQRAIRAPNVDELFLGTAIGFPQATDPCGNPEFLAANPGADQICIQTGVPAGNVGNSAVVQLNQQIPALFGGNPNLQEETSDSWTAGIVLQPAFVPGLTITADYFEVVIEDAIAVAGGGLQGLFELCYGDVQDLNDPRCQPFVGIRNSDGAITVDAPPLVLNEIVSELGVSGIDLQVSYGMTLPFSLLGDAGESDLNLGFLGTWTESSYVIPVADVGAVVQCAGKFGITCSDPELFGSPIPEFKWTARASVIDGPLTTSVRWRHLGSMRDDDDTIDYSDFNGIEEIDAYDVIDLAFAVDIRERYTVTFGVNNLFNTLPGTPEFDANGFVTNRPNSLLLGDNQQQANTYPSAYDVLGRDFFLSLAARF